MVATGNQIEAAADPHGHHGKRRTVAMDPFLLFGVSESHQKDVRPRVIEVIEDLAIVDILQGCAGRFED
jgi:hypothetical protein